MSEIKSGILILNQDVKFEEYARNQEIKEVILESAVLSIDGGGFRDCYKLEKITIHDSFQNMGALAFASSPLHLLNVIMSNGEKISMEFMGRITGNDIMSAIHSLKEGELAGNFSQSFYKYVILLTLYDRGLKENAEILKKNIFKIACKLIDYKSTECFVDLCKHRELFTKKDVDKLIAYSENKKMIKKIKEALSALSLSYGDAKENDKTINQTNIKEKFTIEKSRLIGINQREWYQLILPETIKSIAKGIFEAIKIKYLILPSTLKKITGQNFKNCKYIEEIVISEGTESIGSQAFMGCTKLTKITLPSTIQVIGEAAFSNCEKLEEIIIPENIAKIEGKVFYECKKLKRVILLSSIKIPGRNLESLRDYFSSLFGKCSHLSEIVMAKESVNYTVHNNIVYTKNMRNIIFIPEGLKNINLPLSLRSCDLYRSFDILSFSLSGDYHICMRNESYVKVIKCTAGDKTWTFDLEAQKDVLFEDNYEHMDYGLYCNQKRCLNELTNTVLRFLKNGNVYEASDLGEVAYLDNSGCGPVHYASLFELRFQLAAFIAEVYHKNFLEISQQMISYAIECYSDEENAAPNQEHVRDYFKYHPEYLFSLEKYPELLKIGLTAAIEQGEVKCFEKLCPHLHADNIDACIRISIDNGFTEFTALLIDYKNQIGAYNPIEEQFKL